jgi:hypothetical protein
MLRRALRMLNITNVGEMGKDFAMWPGSLIGETALPLPTS